MLAACCIVKDEATHIGDCLRSIRPAVDQIVVLDTGSRDNTMAIAAEYADVLHESREFTAATRPEDFHFGRARNEALSYCTEPWVLSIDADERFTGDGLSEFLGEQTSRYWAVTLQADDGPEVYVPRVFRNDGTVAWRYRVHELPCDLDRPQTPESIWEQETHTRQIPPHMAALRHVRNGGRINSAQRNLMLLRRQLRECADTQDVCGGLKAIMELGDAYSLLGQPLEALGHYYAALSALDSDSPAVRLYLLHRTAVACANAGLLRTCQQYCRAALHLEPNAVANRALLAWTFEMQGDYGPAMSHYERVLSTDKPASINWRLPVICDFERIKHALSECKTKAGTRGRANDGAHP